MNEPATREDVESAKRDIMALIVQMDASVEASVEGMRSQNSAEHGSLFSKLLHLTELMTWIRSRWERFTRVPDGPPEKRK